MDGVAAPDYSSILLVAVKSSIFTNNVFVPNGNMIMQNLSGPNTKLTAIPTSRTMVDLNGFILPPTNHHLSPKDMDALTCFMMLLTASQ